LVRTADKLTLDSFCGGKLLIPTVFLFHQRNPARCPEMAPIHQKAAFAATMPLSFM